MTLLVLFAGAALGWLTCRATQRAAARPVAPLPWEMEKLLNPATVEIPKTHDYLRTAEIPQVGQ